MPRGGFLVSQSGRARHTPAQLQLGFLNDSGPGVPQKYAEAGIWGRAADFGWARLLIQRSEKDLSGILTIVKRASLFWVFTF
jgi:hypothetical protein